MQTVSITFDELDIENSNRCSYDSVTLYDGHDTKVSQIGRYCGTQRPQAITTSSSSVFIVFVSDWNVNDGRFALTWTVNQGLSRIGVTLRLY